MNWLKKMFARKPKPQNRVPVPRSAAVVVASDDPAFFDTFQMPLLALALHHDPESAPAPVPTSVSEPVAAPAAEPIQHIEHSTHFPHHIEHSTHFDSAPADSPTFDSTPADTGSFDSGSGFDS